MVHSHCEWWQMYCRETTLSLTINVRDVYLAFTAAPSYIYRLQTTNNSPTLICPVEFNYPSQDKDYWLLMNAPKHSYLCCRLLSEHWRSAIGGFFCHCGSQDDTYWFSRPRFGATLSYSNRNNPGGSYVSQLKFSSLYSGVGMNGGKKREYSAGINSSWDFRLFIQKSCFCCMMNNCFGVHACLKQSWFFSCKRFTSQKTMPHDTYMPYNYKQQKT